MICFPDRNRSVEQKPGIGQQITAGQKRPGDSRAKHYHDQSARFVQCVSWIPALEGRDITRISEMVKAATLEQYPVVHPENPEITGPTIAQLCGPPTNAKAHAKNVVTVSTGKLDWSKPSTWTGVIDRPTTHSGGLRPEAFYWECLPICQTKRFAANSSAFFTRTARVNLPAHQAIIALLDSETGTPIAIMDGEYITALRTAAASALSIKLLARTDSRVVAIVGAGVQGDFHLRLMATLDGIETIGHAKEDLVAANLVHQRAIALMRGTTIDL